MNAEQIKTVVMLWNFFKSIDLEVGGELWLEFETSDARDSNSVVISRETINGNELGTTTSIYRAKFDGFGARMLNMIIGEDTILTSDESQIEIIGDSVHYTHCQIVTIDELYSVTLTRFDEHSDVTQQIRATF